MARGDAIAEVLETAQGQNSNIRPTDDGDEWLITIFAGDYSTFSRLYVTDGTITLQITDGGNTYQNFGMKVPFTYSHYGMHHAASANRKCFFGGYVTKEA
tara:strand:+ start:4473 stop:4772 length:300 start_codon:yes stop_codon:yes gene_type:complete